MEKHAANLGSIAMIATETAKLVTGSGIIIFGGVLGYLKANNVPSVEDALSKASIETTIDLAIAYTGVSALSGAVKNRLGARQYIIEGAIESLLKGAFKTPLFAAIGYGIGYGIGKMTR